MKKSIFFVFGILLTLVIAPSAKSMSSTVSIQSEKPLSVDYYTQWGTPIPAPRPEIQDAVTRDNARRQQEAEAWARNPQNPENQDPEIRGLDRIERYFFYVDRGDKKDKKNDLAGALADYNKAIYFYPDDSLAYNNRGVVKVKLNDLSGALEDYGLSIRLETVRVRNSTTFYNRGLLKQRLNDREGAIQDLRQAAKLYKEQGQTEDYQNALNQLQKMNATF
jgi:tetratricopeptide (TPR) repeat protein